MGKKKNSKYDDEDSFVFGGDLDGEADRPLLTGSGNNGSSGKKRHGTGSSSLGGSSRFFSSTIVDKEGIETPVSTLDAKFYPSYSDDSGHNNNNNHNNHNHNNNNHNNNSNNNQSGHSSVLNNHSTYNTTSTGSNDYEDADGNGSSKRNGSSGIHFGMGNRKPKVNIITNSNSPLKAPNASVIGSTFNLANTILGSGVLALPSAMRMVGIVFGCFLISFGAIASSFGLHLLVECARRTGQVSASYFTVASHTYPRASKLIDLAVALKCYGVAISYLIVIGDLVPAAMTSLFEVSEDSVAANRRLWIGLATIILIPLSMLKHMNSLRWTSVAALSTVIYLTCLVVGHYISNGIQVDGDLFPIEYWRWELDVFTALPIVIFAFTCHQNIFTLYGELRNPTDSRISRVIHAAVSNCYFVYLTVGIFGYISFRATTRSNIILNYDGNDAVVWVNICRLAVAILALFSYPLQVHPCRTSIENLFFATASIHAEKNRRITETLVICLSTFLIAFFVTDLDVVLSFVGATGSTTLCYLLPGLFYLKLEKESGTTWHWKKVCALCLVIFGFIMVIVANSVVILKIVNPDALNTNPVIPTPSSSSSSSSLSSSMIQTTPASLTSTSSYSYSLTTTSLAPNSTLTATATATATSTSVSTSVSTATSTFISTNTISTNTDIISTTLSTTSTLVPTETLSSSYIDTTSTVIDATTTTTTTAATTLVSESSSSVLATADSTEIFSSVTTGVVTDAATSTSTSVVATTTAPEFN